MQSFIVVLNTYFAKFESCFQAVMGLIKIEITDLLEVEKMAITGATEVHDDLFPICFAYILIFCY